MSIDFSLILVILTALTGAIWALDAWLIEPKRKLQKTGETVAEEKEEKEPLVVEIAKFLFPVVLIVFLLRGFIAEPFRIPSGSMLPTLEIGDFILVNKFSYGLRVPVLNSKLVDWGSPQRGDVIVFRYPENPSIDYIKRVVGVPGDEIAYYNKVLYVNGKPAQIQADGQYQVGYDTYNKYSEQLGELNHKILMRQSVPAADFVLVVPEKSYFVLGDNRDNSRDSRYWGFVPDENLVGKAIVVWMSWEWGDWPKWHRIGTVIK